MEKLVSFSSLETHETIASFIKEYFQISNAQLKKSGLSKKFLNRELRVKDTISLPLNIVNFMQINPVSDVEGDLILAESQDFLVLHKPPRVHMHPHSYDDTNTLLNYIRTINSKLLEVNKSSYDRGLLYRLDYETSGLVIYAKSDELYHEFRKNFNSKVKEKYYLAICSGKLESTTLKDDISYRSEKKSTGYVSHHGEYAAFIRVEHLKYNEKLDLSLVKIFLYEGIRHQIRIQLSHIGHAILGDKLYKGRSADRLYLHCYEYSLEHLKFIDNRLVDFMNFFDFDGEL